VNPALESCRAFFEQHGFGGRFRSSFTPSAFRRAAEAFGFSEVRVFGSTVRGTDTERSDVNLLVNASDDGDYLTVAAFRDEVSKLICFPVDAIIDDNSLGSSRDTS